MGKELRNGKQFRRVKLKQQDIYEGNIEKREMQNVTLHCNITKAKFTPE